MVDDSYCCFLGISTHRQWYNVVVALFVRTNVPIGEIPKIALLVTTGLVTYGGVILLMETRSTTISRIFSELSSILLESKKCFSPS